MVYLYAALGVVMMTGIMAIFEMGLSLTGQSLLLIPPDEYDYHMQLRDAKLLAGIAQTSFKNDVNDPLIGLCSALNRIESGMWSPVMRPGYWFGSCQLTKESEPPKLTKHRVIVRKNTHQLFSCALIDGESKCFFEIE